MIARVKETGEIVELINDEKLSMLDYARGIYRDTYGNRYHCKELEFIERPHKNIDWEQRRYEIAKDMMMAAEQHNNDTTGFKNPMAQAKYAIECADALIEELKKGGNNA